MSTLDHNLRVGLLALQMGIISRHDLLEAVAEWKTDKLQSLIDILLRRGLIEASACNALNELSQHTSDLAGEFNLNQCFSSLPHGQELEQALREIGDVDLNETLGPAGDWSTVGPESGQPLAINFQPAKERFHVIHMHAKGGLGEVWLAEDADLRRQVALKEIRGEHADNDESRSRFVQEAEITGRLEHPGIVPVYALGQHGDGRPYYVMRFIRGHSLQSAIDRYHESRLGKSIDDAPTLRQLLARLVDVCEAVAYAHSRGVLHRDLKPENIMLGLYGETLVVDWGLAKADGTPSVAEKRVVTDESVVKITSGTPTRLGSALGTPGYMSPEQAFGATDQLTPATDIYSLGATMFTLLTGRAPIQGKDVSQILEDTREGNIPLPRSLVSNIPLPLQSICLRALEARSTDRYATALEMAADLQHYLDDEPVKAHRESLVDRTSRWVRRHKSSVIAGAATLTLVAVVASGAAILIAQSRDHALQLADDNAKLATAERESREDAQRRQRQAEQATEQALQQQARAEKYYQLAISTVDQFLTGVADDDRLKAVGLENLRRDLLVQARDFYELVIEQADDGESPLHAERANAQQRLAEISFQVGEYEDAIAAYREAASHFLAMGEDNANASEYTILINDLALTLDAAGHADEALKLWRELVEPLRELIAADPDEPRYHDLLATVQLNTALQLTTKAPAESLALSAEAKQHARNALKLVPDDIDSQNTLALLHNNHANTLISQERYQEAAAELEEADAIWSSLAATAEGWVADYYSDHMALMYLNRGVVAANLGDTSQAERYIQEGLDIRKRVAAKHPDAVQLQTRLATLQVTAANNYRNMGEYAASLEQSTTALEILERLHAASPELPTYRSHLAMTLLEHGTTQVAVGALQDANASIERAIKLTDSLVIEASERADYRRQRAICRYYMGQVLAEASEVVGAAEALEAAAAEMEELISGNQDDLELTAYLTECQTLLGAVYSPTVLANEGKAQHWWQQARKTSDRMLNEPFISRLPPSLHLTALKHRAEALTGLELYEAALLDWEAAFAANHGAVDYDLGTGKAITLFSAHRFEEALELIRQTGMTEQHAALVFAVARETSLGVQALTTFDLPATDLARWTKAYSAVALEMLRRAAEMGYFADPETIEFLEQDVYLDALRDREDFQAFLEELE